MSKQEKNKKDKKNNTNNDQILTLIGLGLSAVLFILSAVFVCLMHYVDLFPVKYKIIGAVALFIIVVIIVVLQRFRIAGIVSKVIAVLMIIVLSVGCVYLVYTRVAVDKVSDIDYMIDVVGVYVMEESPVKDMSDLSGKTIGRGKVYDQENTDYMVDYVADNYDVKFTYKDYDSFFEMFTDLVEGRIEAVIANSKYLSMYSDLDEYDGLENLNLRVRAVVSVDIKSQIKETPVEKIVVDNTPTTPTEVKKEHNNPDVICIYLSGIDTYGAVASVSRSDVNILMFINQKTHQILLLNTPRDFYVPLSISNGMGDKLTHAGIYGINVSEETLAMLYDTKVDYYLKVNFTGFANIIDKLGGITVYSSYEFTSENAGGYYFHAGDNYLSGEEALGFARERETLPGGDRERGRNQMRIIDAVFNKIISPAILTNYLGILDSISNSMITDMPYEVIGDIVKRQLDSLAEWNIVTYSADGTGDFQMTYSAPEYLYVMIPDEEKINQAKEYIDKIYDNEIVVVD